MPWLLRRFSLVWRLLYLAWLWLDLSRGLLLWDCLLDTSLLWWWWRCLLGCWWVDDELGEELLAFLVALFIVEGDEDGGLVVVELMLFFWKFLSKFDNSLLCCVGGLHVEGVFARQDFWLILGIWLGRWSILSSLLWIIWLVFGLVLGLELLLGLRLIRIVLCVHLIV